MKNNQLPSIETIVKERVDAGIAGPAEVLVYFKGDLDDADYSDETKRSLLAELEKSKHETVVPITITTILDPGISVAMPEEMVHQINHILDDLGLKGHVYSDYRPTAVALTVP